MLSLVSALRVTGPPDVLIESSFESRRGRVSLYARADEGTPPATVFMPFCYYEAAANKLTNPVLDPFGKIPEFKFCAARAERAEMRDAAE